MTYRRKPNEITNNTYKDMWCKHRLTASFNNKIAYNMNSVCIGMLCPSLVFINKKNNDDWIGYCGIDHPHEINR